MSWRTVWERRRVGISQAGGLILFLFARPVSPAMFNIGFLVAASGEVLRLWAAGHIRKGQSLATEGPYALVRNPLYLGSILLAGGFALMCTSARHWLSSALIWTSISVTFGWLYAEKIAMEEEDLLGRYGAEFERYRSRVPAICPSLSRVKPALASASFSLSQALRNKEHRTVLAVLGLAVLLRFRLIYNWL